VEEYATGEKIKSLLEAIGFEEVNLSRRYMIQEIRTK
jgi:hypothetical protein